MDTTPGRIAHVALNVDDLAAARSFYEATFGWTFEPWFGMEDFFRISGPDGAEPGPFAVMQQRREIAGRRVVGLEGTVAVEDIEAVIAAAEAAGGAVLAPPTVIPTVGTLAWLEDPSGNVIGAMQYEAALPQGDRPRER